MRKIKLICIPYAGGSVQVYKSWNRYLDDSIELIPIELAGRGRRFLESRYKNMKEAVDDIFKTVSTLIQNSDYAVFGHSMGSVIAYELIHKIRDESLHCPKHVFFSGRYPPFVKKEKQNLHDAPLEMLINELEELGGTPREILRDIEFIQTYIPIIRSDYMILETYESVPRNIKFDFDISILSGKQDKDIDDKDLEMWKSCTSGNCNIYVFDGGHFFINEFIEDVVKVINNVLIPYTF